MRHAATTALIPLLSLFAGPALSQPPSAPPSSATAPAGTELPRIFAGVPFAEALKDSADGAGFLFVKGTADWCMPCKQMDRTTFVDPRVRAFFAKDNRIIEVDSDRQPEIARPLKMRMLPTTLVYKGGVEIDRAVGLINPDQFAAWIDRLKGGQTNMSIIAGRIDAAAKGGQAVAVSDRVVYTDHLLCARRYDDATAELARLWEDTASAGGQAAQLRASFVPEAMRELADAHPPAKDRLKALRDAAAGKAKAAPASAQPADDLLILNDILGDSAATLAWFDAAKASPEGLALARRLAPRLEPALVAAGRWVDLGKLPEDPSAGVRQMAGVLARLRAASRPELPQMLTMYRAEVAKLYAALLAADREADAASMLSAAIPADDTGELRLAVVSRALDAKQPRPAQRELLDAAAAKGTDVEAARKALVAALDGK